MKLEFKCNYCNSIFEPTINKHLNFYYSVCPYCASTDTELTEKSKLLLDRKQKIKNISDTRRIDN